MATRIVFGTSGEGRRLHSIQVAEAPETVAERLGKPVPLPEFEQVLARGENCRVWVNPATVQFLVSADDGPG